MAWVVLAFLAFLVGGILFVVSRLHPENVPSDMGPEDPPTGAQ